MHAFPCCHCRGRHAKGLARFGLPKGAFMLYVDDLYHTLLNMPRYRFLLSFFVVYLTLVRVRCVAWPCQVKFNIKAVQLGVLNCRVTTCSGCVPGCVGVGILLTTSRRHGLAVLYCNT